MIKHLALGILMAKVDYWRTRYSLHVHIFDDVHIHVCKEEVEIKMFIEFTSIEDALKAFIDWAEQAYPRYKYPDGIEITNPYAGT